MSSRFLNRIADLESLAHRLKPVARVPFLEPAFLDLLERCGCVSATTGWQPHHLLLEDSDALTLLPLYLKNHSMGEYVFDWAWADAYQRHGLRYYPKLLTAIPFTPATGPRLLGDESDRRVDLIVERVTEEAQRLGVSSWHVLFPPEVLAGQLEERGLLRRRGVQYHWFNSGYRDFDDFLARMTSRRRKSIARERRKVSEQGLEIERLHGAEISADLWALFYTFYSDTYLKRNGSLGYLNESFFTALTDTLGDRVMLVCARHGGRIVAAGLFFHDDDTLYGRYWGCRDEYDFLHFEVCYYQGIEFAIEKGLQRFDAGAQGEHKLLRGFEPVETCSLHWIAHPSFASAIEDFLNQESKMVARHLQQAREVLPFRKAD